MTVPTPAKSLGEEGQPGSGINHGSFYSYARLRCRCEKCRQANRDHQRRQDLRGSAFLELTPEQRRHCQICQIRLSEHPLKWCWREMR